MLSASLRAQSLNWRLARLAADAFERHGATVDLVSMRDFDPPSYDHRRCRVVEHTRDRHPSGVDQRVWLTTSPLREDLRELVSFLIDQSGRFMIAEENIGGRAACMASPSSHNRGNLVAEAHEYHAEAASILAGHVTTSSVGPGATR